MDDDIKELIDDLSLCLLKAGWDYIDDELLETEEFTRINLLMDAGVDFLTKLVASYRTLNPQGDTEYKLEEMIAELRGGCFHTPYKMDEYVN